MLTNMNVLIIGRNDRLRDHIEMLGAETCVAASFDNALEALRVYSLHCAILLGSLDAFETETLSEMLMSVQFPFRHVSDAANDTRSTAISDRQLVFWLRSVWHEHQPHEFDWDYRLAREFCRN